MRSPCCCCSCSCCYRPFRIRTSACDRHPCCSCPCCCGSSSRNRASACDRYAYCCCSCSCCYTSFLKNTSQLLLPQPLVLFFSLILPAVATCPDLLFFRCLRCSSLGRRARWGEWSFESFCLEVSIDSERCIDLGKVRSNGWHTLGVKS